MGWIARISCVSVFNRTWLGTKAFGEYRNKRNIGVDIAIKQRFTRPHMAGSQVL